MDLLTGNIKKIYCKYLVAAFGSAMISCIYGMVDAAVVGHYAGPQGAAALAVVMPIWTIIYSLGLLIGIGGSVTYSFYKGQEKYEKANAYFTLSLVMTAIIGVLCWGGIIVFDNQLLKIFGADDTLLPLAKEYLLPIKFVIPLYPFTQMLAAFLRNDNAPGVATKAVLFGGIFNVVGDLLFVFGFDMGMFGAGLATALGAVMSIAGMAGHFFSRRNTLKLEKVYGQLHKVKLVAINGVSSFVSDVAMGIVAMFFNRQIMKFFGADALAVYGVIVQVTCIIQCSAYGTGQAAQPIISTNFGAGEWSRVKETNKYGVMAAALFSVIWTVLVLLIPNVFIKLYMAPTENVLAIAPAIMRLYGISYLFLPFNIYSTYYFQSVMRPKTAVAVSLLRGLILCSILVYFMPAVFGREALWLVMVVTELIVVIFAAVSMGKRI